MKYLTSLKVAISSPLYYENIITLRASVTNCLRTNCNKELI